MNLTAEQIKLYSKTMEILVNTNTHEYNHLKAIEELNELSEVLAKKLNKKDGPKEPPDQAIIEELGDVTIRAEILIKMYGSEKVVERIFDKITKYAEYIENNKYIGKI